MDLTALGAGALQRLEAKHLARERSLRLSRQAVRDSANAIRAAHRGDLETARGLVDAARAALDEAVAACAAVPAVRWAGFVHDAEKEYAEARGTVAVLAGEPLPGPDDVGVDDAAWLNGLAETVGELRRHALDQLRAGHTERCEALLETMDDVYALLVSVDYPDGITGGLRRATDVARSIIERTRGDVTTALLQDRLRAALDDHRRILPS